MDFFDAHGLAGEDRAEIKFFLAETDAAFRRRISSRGLLPVTEGSRGIGKGVARALAERSATVYIAGRSQAGEIRPSLGGAFLPGTIQEAAEEVNSLGVEVKPVYARKHP